MVENLALITQVIPWLSQQWTKKNVSTNPHSKNQNY